MTFRWTPQKFIDKVNALPRTIEALNDLDVGAVIQILSLLPPDVAQKCWEPVAQLMLDIAEANPASRKKPLWETEVQ